MGARPRVTPAQTMQRARQELTSGVYRFVREGDGYRPITFMPDGRVGIGATASERTWGLRLAGGGPSLEIGSERGVSCAFTASGADAWTSRSGVALERLPGPADERLSASLSFNQFVDRLLAYAEPLSENVGPGNLGLGWLYYGFTRNLSPGAAIVIGSARGFAPLCVARALRDDGGGSVIFIDPGEPDQDGGAGGHWEHESEARKWLSLFGLGDSIHHVSMRPEDACSVVRAMVPERCSGLLVIDAARSADRGLRDFDLYSPLLTRGVALLHGRGAWGAHDTLRARGLDVAMLDVGGGLAIVPIGPSARAGRAG